MDERENNSLGVDNNAKDDQSIKRLATEKNPSVEAIIANLYRLETEQQAIDKINALKENFIISAKLPPSEHENSIKLWVRGYKITDDEEKKGFLGNYAEIRPLQLADGKYTVSSKKLDIALKYHPQRKRPKGKHPDWGHPCSVNKLFCIVYSKAETPPVQKYVFEIMASKDGEGGFYIDSKVNKYSKKNSKPDVKSAGKKSSGKGSSIKVDEPLGKGYFASMVELKRNKKSQIDDLRKKSKEKPTEES